MTSSYYLWKWAENDVPGKPDQVFSALVRGELHPALQTFNAQPLLRCLDTFAAGRRALGEDWNWQVHPACEPTAARFVFLTGPHLHDSEYRMKAFEKAMRSLGLSGYDEQYGHVIHLFPPKFNCLLFGQDHRERYYDVTADEVPILLGHVDGTMRAPFVVLEDNRSCFVQCYASERHFHVEWRENYDPDNSSNFQHWRAWPPTQACPSQAIRDSDMMSFADTVRIFQTFLKGKPKPSCYDWKNITTEELERSKKQERKVVSHD